MKKYLLPCVMSLAAMPAVADAERILEVNAGLMGSTSGRGFATGDTFRMVNRDFPAGFTLGMSLKQPLDGSLYSRFHVDAFALQGKAGTGLSDGMLPRQLGAGIDLLWEEGRMTVFGGMMGMRWHQDRAKATDPRFSDQPVEGGQNRPTGTKFAGRIGIEWRFTPRLHGTLSYTQAEFNKCLNPGWITLGASFRFASF